MHVLGIEILWVKIFACSSASRHIITYYAIIIASTLKIIDTLKYVLIYLKLMLFVHEYTHDCLLSAYLQLPDTPFWKVFFFVVMDTLLFIFATPLNHLRDHFWVVWSWWSLNNRYEMMFLCIHRCYRSKYTHFVLWTMPRQFRSKSHY